MIYNASIFKLQFNATKLYNATHACLSLVFMSGCIAVDQRCIFKFSNENDLRLSLKIVLYWEMLHFLLLYHVLVLKRAVRSLRHPVHCSSPLQLPPGGNCFLKYHEVRLNVSQSSRHIRRKQFLHEFNG